MPDPDAIRRWKPFKSQGRRPWEPEVPEPEGDELEIARRHQRADERRATQSVPPPSSHAVYSR
jgi:hypothetical protein